MGSSLARVGVHVPVTGHRNPLASRQLTRVVLRQRTQDLGIHAPALSRPNSSAQEVWRELTQSRSQVKAIADCVPRSRLLPRHVQFLDHFVSDRSLDPHTSLDTLSDALADLHFARVHSEALSIGRGRDLALSDIWQVAFENRPISFASEAREEVLRTRAGLERAVAEGRAMYGINTGFGKLAGISIPTDRIDELQVNIIRSHAVGVGEPLNEPYVRAMMLLRAHSLAQGYSGVRPEVIDLLVGLLNHGVHPYVSEKGSVGASGDLIPLAQIAQVLIGESYAYYDDQLMPAQVALSKAGLEPIQLHFKEGLALINGTQFITAIAAITLLQAEHLLDVADAATALTLEVTGGRLDPFHSEIQRVRRQPGQARTAERIHSFLLESGTRSILAQNHPRRSKVQDPYNLRCAPQVNGAVYQAFANAHKELAAEANAVTDNPLVFVADDGSVEVVSGGNFHGQAPAMAADALASGLATVSNLSQAQLVNLLTNTENSGLPLFLVPGQEKAGISSAYMMIDVAAAALAAEGVSQAFPASVLTRPTAGGQEDHVSMGPIAARKAAAQLVVTEQILSLELLAAAQALDHWGWPTTTRLGRIHSLVREGSAPLTQDRSLTEDVAYVQTLLAARALAPIVDTP